MRRQFGVLAVVGLALILLGRLADQDGVWAAPGQSPERQSYPSMTPTDSAAVKTDTPPPAPTDTPPPSQTLQPTNTSGLFAFTASPSVTAAAPGEATPTVLSTGVVEVTMTPTPSASPIIRPSETISAAGASPEAAETRSLDSEATPTSDQGSSTATIQPGRVQTAAAVPTVDSDGHDLLIALERDWMLLCGLSLLILALLLFTLGRIQRRGPNSS